VQPATFGRILLFLVIAAIVVWGALPMSDDTSSPRHQEAAATKTATTKDGAPASDSVEIPGLDWQALGTVMRNYVAAKGAKGEWAETDELLTSLDAFIQAAGQPGPGDTIDKEQLQLLGEGMRRWGDAEAEWPTLVMSAVLKASENQEVWGPLLGALGEGVMAGVHEQAVELRPRLVKWIAETQARLSAPQANADAELESELAQAKEALATIDRVPEPSESARVNWADFLRLQEGESRSRAEPRR